MGTMKSNDLSKIPYKHHEKRLLYFAHPRTASHATSRALVEQAGFEGSKKWHHKSLNQRLDGWSAATTVRNHFDAIVSWHEFKPWRVRPLDIAFVNALMDEHPYYFPEPDCLWALHAPVSDYILRFETLQSDLNGWLAAHDLGPVELPIDNVSESRADRAYQTYYDQETRRYVEKRFAAEMAELGYRWEA